MPQRHAPECTRPRPRHSPCGNRLPLFTGKVCADRAHAHDPHIQKTRGDGVWGAMEQKTDLSTNSLKLLTFGREKSTSGDDVGRVSPSHGGGHDGFVTPGCVYYRDSARNGTDIAGHAQSRAGETDRVSMTPGVADRDQGTLDAHHARCRFRSLGARSAETPRLVSDNEPTDGHIAP
jgi:hypothetical protein